MYKQKSTRIGVLQVIKDSSNLRIPWPLCLRQECGEDILLPNSQEQSMFLPQGNLQYQAGVLNEAKSNYLATHLEVQNQHVFFWGGQNIRPVWQLGSYKIYILECLIILKRLGSLLFPRLPSPNARPM